MINKIEEMKKKISTKIIFNYKCTIFMTYVGFQIDVSDWPRVPSNQNKFENYPYVDTGLGNLR